MVKIVLNKTFQINGSETATLGELLDIVCHMHEFQCFKLRATDRKVLNELNEGTTVEKSTNCGVRLLWVNQSQLSTGFVFLCPAK